MNAGMRASSFALAALALLVVVAAMLRAGVAEHGSFKAFYCGAYAVREGANPYLVEPLRSCEHTVAPQALPAQAVEPAPIPGYALGVLIPFTLLPFAKAAAAFAILSLIAALAAALLLERLTTIPAAAIAAVMGPLVLLNVAYGELPLFTMAALAASGYALARGQYAQTAAFAAAAMLQPQIGIAAAAALFVLVPRVRILLAAAFAALAVVCVASLGPDVTLAYARSVLPAQAASEVAAADQYGLAHQLYLLGAAPHAAVLAAEVASAVVLVLGVWAAALAARRLRAPELIVFLPGATMLLGGIYAHDIQLIVALPAAVVATARITESRRALALISLLALAVVWTEYPGRALLLVDIAAIAAACAVYVGGAVAFRAATGVLCAFAFAVGIVYLHEGRRTTVVTRQMATVDPASLAANGWHAYLDATPARTDDTLQHTGQKVPAWLGIALLLAVSVRRI